MISSPEMERMMKVQEVILKAMAGSLKWWEAAEIIGVTDRTMRRWRERYQEGGHHFSATAGAARSSGADVHCAVAPRTASRVSRKRIFVLHGIGAVLIE